MKWIKLLVNSLAMMVFTVVFFVTFPIWFFGVLFWVLFIEIGTKDLIAGFSEKFFWS